MIAGLYGESVLSLVGNCPTIFQVEGRFCTPTTNDWVFLLLHTFTALVLSIFLDFSHSNRCVVASRCCFNL